MSEYKVYCATCIRVSIRISVFWVFFMVHTLMNVFGCCVGDIWLQNVVPQPRNIV